MSVLSLADAKVWLSISGTDKDARIQAVIDAAEAAIATQVGRLSPTAVTAVLASTRGYFVLPEYPVVSVESMVDADGIPVDLSAATIDLARGTIYASSAWDSRPYTASYTAGRTSVEADLLMAVRLLVQHMWAPQRGGSTRPGSSPSEELANTLPGAAYSMPIRVTQLLGPHIVPGIG